MRSAIVIYVGILCIFIPSVLSPVGGILKNIFPPKTVKVTSACHTPVKFHCWSSDDYFEERVMNYGDSYNWSFQTVPIIDYTVFTCHVHFFRLPGGNKGYFVAYLRDRCGGQLCEWRLTNYGSVQLKRYGEWWTYRLVQKEEDALEACYTAQAFRNGRCEEPGVPKS